MIYCSRGLCVFNGPSEHGVRIVYLCLIWIQCARVSIRAHATSCTSSFNKKVHMSNRTMNLKLNNEVRSSVILNKPPIDSIKEERRRTGRYIAILVGICLFLLAIYHAWIRRIPVVASLVVPALIMFFYVGWVLYTASKDKQKILDAEAALTSPCHGPHCHGRHHQVSPSNLEISVISSKETSKTNSPGESSPNEWSEISSVFLKGDIRATDPPVCFVKPIILINDKPQEDLDEKWTSIVESLSNNEKLKGLQSRRRFKRKFCRSRRHAIFKRSYSIG